MQQPAPAMPRRTRTVVAPYRGPQLRLPPHPDSPDPIDLAAVRRWVRSVAGPTAVDLFCGAGGLSLGLRNAGFTVLLGADSDESSAETHRANIGGLTYEGDLSDPEDFLDHLDAWGVRQVDLVAGGVPCQPFSRAGRSKLRSLVRDGQRSLDDPRASLWRSFVAVVERLRPTAVLLENVPDLAVWDEGGVLIGFCESLRELGYLPDAAIMNAFEHGVPQHRTRLFIVAVSPGVEFDWPRPRRTRPSVRSAIGDLPRVPGAQREERLPYAGPPSTPFQRLMRKGMREADAAFIDDHITRDVRPDDAEAFALLAEGQTYSDLPSHLQRYRVDIFRDKYKRLEWDGLSRSITAHLAKDGYWYIHPEQDRTLSVREAARIQTFPDWFRFSGQPSLRYRQIGNAVPPLLAEAIGRKLLDGLTAPRRRGRPRGSGTSFRESLLRWHRTHVRPYPWRDGVDPWHVLMAEMCLHRTRADQVVPVYTELCRLAPTPAAMVERSAEAHEAMRSLGLRWRADSMLEVARTLVTRHGGTVPSSEIELRRLPGVGDYVAQAVLTFGFGRRAVLVDTNTERIVARLKGRLTVDRWQMRLDLHQLAGREGPEARFNYGLLDLGALVCRARSPLCEECPVRRHCATGRAAAPDGGF